MPFSSTRLGGVAPQCEHHAGTQDPLRRTERQQRHDQAQQRQHGEDHDELEPRMMCRLRQGVVVVVNLGHAGDSDPVWHVERNEHFEQVGRGLIVAGAGGAESRQHPGRDASALHRLIDERLVLRFQDPHLVAFVGGELQEPVGSPDPNPRDVRIDEGVGLYREDHVAVERRWDGSGHGGVAEAREQDRVRDGSRFGLHG